MVSSIEPLGGFHRRFVYIQKSKPESAGIKVRTSRLITFLIMGVDIRKGGNEFNLTEIYRSLGCNLPRVVGESGADKTKRSAA